MKLALARILGLTSFFLCRVSWDLQCLCAKTGTWEFPFTGLSPERCSTLKLRLIMKANFSWSTWARSVCLELGSTSQGPVTLCLLAVSKTSTVKASSRGACYIQYLGLNCYAGRIVWQTLRVHYLHGCLAMDSCDHNLQSLIPSYGGFLKENITKPGKTLPH